MGKAVSRIWSRGAYGGFGNPQPHPTLRKLQGWRREALQDAFENFKMCANFTVDQGTFFQLLFPDSLDGDAVFDTLKNKKNRVDFLSVFGAMVATSDQCCISRVSFLFSIYDLDSSGSVNRAEFFIAIRSLLMGLARFYESAVLPQHAELENMCVEVFDKIDEDKSDSITLGEFLAFAYRNADIHALFSPFPSTDERIFEELVVFPWTSDSLKESEERAIAGAERRLSLKLKIAPDPVSRRLSKPRASMAGTVSRRQSVAGAKKRQTVASSGLSKIETMVMWTVFKTLSGGSLASSRVVKTETLRRELCDAEGISQLVQESARKVSDLFGDFEASNAAISRITHHLIRQFSDPQVVQGLDAMSTGSASLRAFFCVLLPTVREKGIEKCLSWCTSFHVWEVLQHILSDSDIPQLTNDDIDALFKVLDLDSSGKLSVDELCTEGGLEASEAQQLLERWDRDRSGELDADELKSVLRGLDRTLQASFRHSFKQVVSMGGPEPS
mmetsp:Transcript_54754/g.152816  ORF Transcript_54754/g.152816 Transcript_54754/m.152816 type:complete len:500 (+) Transcript_54754:138-1637(+)